MENLCLCSTSDLQCNEPFPWCKYVLLRNDMHLISFISRLHIAISMTEY